MHLVFSFFQWLFTSRVEKRKPMLGEFILFVQEGYRNAYDGYCGLVEHVDEQDGFSIRAETSSLHCYSRRRRHLYRVPTSCQLYCW